MLWWLMACAGGAGSNAADSGFEGAACSEGDFEAHATYERDEDGVPWVDARDSEDGGCDASYLWHVIQAGPSVNNSQLDGLLTYDFKNGTPEAVFAELLGAQTQGDWGYEYRLEVVMLTQTYEDHPVNLTTIYHEAPPNTVAEVVIPPLK